MNRASTFLGGVALGAGLMYLLDTDRGARRRALVRDKAIRSLHISRDFLGKASRDLQHRAQGVAAEVKHRVLHSEVTDAVLAERVRSKLGRYNSHPHAIEVDVDQGTVTLRGPILTDEAARLLRAINAVPGVKSVDDQLERHMYSGNVPALQGGGRYPGVSTEWQKNWTPGLQLLAALASGAAMLYGTNLIRTQTGNQHPSEHDGRPHEFAGATADSEMSPV